MIVNCHVCKSWFLLDAKITLHHHFFSPEIVIRRVSPRCVCLKIVRETSQHQPTFHGSSSFFHIKTTIFGAETARSAAMLASLEQAPIMGIGDAWWCKLSAEKLVCRLLQIVFVLGGPLRSEGAKAWTCALTIWSRTTTLFFKLCSLMFVDLQFNNEIPKSAHTSTKTKLFFFLLQSLEWCQDWTA